MQAEEITKIGSASGVKLVSLGVTDRRTPETPDRSQTSNSGEAALMDSRGRSIFGVGSDNGD